ARMDAVEVPVNWSAVASQAFEAKLLELESTKEVGGMDDVIARMKAADELDQKEAYQEGREAGERWAKEVARPKQLRQLAKLANNQQYGLADWLDIYTKHHGIACELFKDIHPREESDSHSVDAFWAEALGEGGTERIEDRDFALGFLEGALDVWN